ncbi:MAG: hypothetical protein ACU85E_03560 [Gammaproteobacteria bacterium]
MGKKIDRKFPLFALVSILAPDPIVYADEMMRASVDFTELERPASVPPKKTAQKKSQWYELHGSLNREYVYLIVKKTGKREIEGYLFDGLGNKKYVYGEWFDTELQIYDRSNKRFIVILNR